MVRSMYAGVAGMKANQQRMDVIGNNIANSNTYGFKASRATFRDIYYQQYRGASEGTLTRGGINPSNVGYGAQLASIDLMMDSASLTSTGFALDCGITGDGFFQVMDPDGNIYYTKAGMLDIDPATGAVIDSNGNFVLGTSATNGKLDSTHPGQNKIIIALDSVAASTAKVTKEIGGRMLTIESTNQNKDANISFTFSKSNEMPDGMKVRIVREGTSSVYNVQLNSSEYFKDLGELSDLINQAIEQNYGGKHPGGTYKFTMEQNPFEETKAVEGDNYKGLTGAELVDTPTVEYEGGSVTIKNGPLGFDIDSVGLTFSGADTLSDGTSPATASKDMVLQWIPPNEDTGVEGHVLVTITTGNGETYEGRIFKSRLDSTSSGGTVLLTRKSKGTDDKVDPNDTIIVKYPSRNSILKLGSDGETVESLAASLFEEGKTPGMEAKFEGVITATPQQPTKKCGWGKATLTLEGGTEFHTQDLTNITGISIGADGVISGTTENGLEVLGRIDLATFGNAKGLDQVGSSYFAESANSGPVQLAIAGESGTGAIKNSALEMSNVDLAQEFSDMIVTQRGFQASSRMITVSDTMLEELTNLKR